MSRTAKQRRRSHRHGIAAEYAALLFLLLKAYRPLAMRYKTPVGEIDLVLKRGGTLVFVEVKARADAASAAEAVHGANRARVVRAAQYFIAGRPEFADHPVRFDVCLVPWYRLPHHIPQAFEAS
ncbi:MAG: YraN family protein [Alphaproteobacteria bacterium]